MALKQDERALLQLVCERGQSYEDLAGLLGISEDEVRAKARHALTELGGADPDSEVGLTDYLLSQADPIGRADAVRYLQQDAEARELATTISTKLQAIAPGATLPAIPEPRGRKRKAAVDTSTPSIGSAVTPAGAGTPTAGSGRSSHQTRLIAAIGAGGVILVFIILAVAGVFDGSESGGDSSSPTPEAAAAESQRVITPVKLDAVGGSGVAGVANFKLANDQLYVDLSLDGLDPKISKDDAYVIWLMINDSLGYPVAQLPPDQNGSVSQSIAVPTPVAAAVGANAKSVLVTKSSRSGINAGIKKAIAASQPVLTVTGDRLAQGNIPLAKGGASATGAGATSTTPDTTTTAPDTTTGG